MKILNLQLNKKVILEEAFKMGTLPGAVLGGVAGLGASALVPDATIEGVSPEEAIENTGRIAELKSLLPSTGIIAGALAGNGYREYQDGKQNKPFNGNSQIDRTFAGMLTAPAGALAAVGLADHYGHLNDFSTPELLAGGAAGVGLGVGAGMLSRKLGKSLK